MYKLRDHPLFQHFHKVLATVPVHKTSLANQHLGLWKLCSKYLSIFYSEFLLKYLHYAQFYSFMLLILSLFYIWLAIIKLLRTFFTMYIANSVAIASYLQMYFQNTANTD